MIRGGGKLSFLAVVLMLGVYLLTGCGDDDDGSPTAPGPGQGPEGFVHIQPGTFTMGSPGDEPGRDSDETQHQVTVTKAFYISDHEVTQAEWEAVMGWNDSYFSGDSRPVEQVTWFDCIDFCNKKSQSEGLTPAYTLTSASYSGDHITSATVTWNQNANGYRLPTEAEWEYACRAGSTTAFCNGAITELYCGIDPNLTMVGWYCGSETNVVMGKSPNAWNLFDMHGSVFEWCWDWYGSYSGPDTDPTGPASGSFRVLRGGSWDNYARYCRSAYRYSNPPGDWLYSVGFRLSRTAP